MAIVTCANCDAKNRIDETRTGARPVCGRCQTPLPPAGTAGGSHPAEITDAGFEGTLAGAGDKPVLVDCWATWCPPCKMIAPTIDAIAAESNGRWVVGKLDVDENPATAQRFRVGSIPTLLIFRRGNLVETLVGVQPKAALLAKLQAHAG